jgi:hypothetical protein
MGTIGRYFSWKVLLGAVGLALISFIILSTLLWVSKPEQTVVDQGTAIVIMIPAPSPTPLVSAPTTIPTAGSDPVDAIQSGEIKIGSYVQVTGTAGTGLRLRMEPSLNSEIRLLGSEDGPRQAKGYTWWYLVGPYDDARHGWAVQDYLVVIQTP